MIAADSRQRSAADSGFVLVGVVMFVLALTILALSLFSLSGYEAQFLTSSVDRSQAFYDAISGIERTKFILAATNGDLSAPRRNRSPGVVEVYAAQGSNVNSGNVDWNSSEPILIRVTAEVSSNNRRYERTVVEAQFTAQRDSTLYHDVIATPGNLQIAPSSDPNSQGVNMYLYGTVRAQNAVPWQSMVGSPPPSYLGGGVPAPQVGEFMQRWLPFSTGAPDITDSFKPDGEALTTYTFDLQGKPVRVFSGPTDQLNPENGVTNSNFGLSDGHQHDVHFRITGGTGTSPTVLWLLPHGGHFYGSASIEGPEDANLIIVGGQTTESGAALSGYSGAALGLWFRGGIGEEKNPPATPLPHLFLITDGGLAIDKVIGISETAIQLPHIAIFASNVYLQGPSTTLDHPRFEQLTHQVPDDNAILKPLIEQQLLPNTLGGNHRFAMNPGTWKQYPDSSAYR